MRFLQVMWPASRSAKVDSVVFRLFYRCTALILLVFSLIITCRLWFGDSFGCQSIQDERSSIIDMYCYAHNPFIVVSAMSKSVGKEIAYRGVSLGNTPQDKLVHTSYYPWVNLFFLVLATLFYLPHLFWRICEGGLMTRLTAKVNDSSVSEVERKAAIMEIAKYILTTRGSNLLYMGAYVLSEVLNFFVGVLLTIWLVDFFKVEMFFESEEFKMESWEDFFDFNFPMAARCVYHRYGASGDVQRHDTVCFLPLNKLYGYMFLFLYAWFTMLCVLSALVMPDSVIVVLLPPIRLLVFRIRSGVAEHSALNFVNANMSFGEWFILTRLQKNLLAHDLTKLLICIQQNFNKNPLELEMDDLGKLN